MTTSPPLITTRFDASSTADEVAAGAHLRGIRAIVTGASSGLGLPSRLSVERDHSAGWGSCRGGALMAGRQQIASLQRRGPL
jgi:hypothetical protein